MLNIKLLKQILAPHKFKLLLCAIFALIWTSLESTTLYLTKIAVDRYANDLHNKIFFISFILIGCFLLVELLIKGANLIVLKFLPHFVIDIQHKVLSTLLDKNLFFFKSTNLGSLNATISNVTLVIESIFKVFFYSILAGSFGFIFTIFLVGISHYWLAVYFSMWLATMIMISFRLMRKLDTYTNLYTKTFSEASSSVADIVANISTIKAFSKEAYELQRFKKTLDILKDDKIALEKTSFKIDLYKSIASGIFFLLLIYYFNTSISSKNLTLGDFVFILSASLMCKRDVWHISIQITDIYKKLGFLKQTLLFLPQSTSARLKTSTKADAVSSTDAVEVPDVTETIESTNTINFSTINLRYISFKANECPILRNIFLKLQQGEKIAIIGPSGSGKSTLAQIIALLYEPTKGKVYINDCPSSTLNIEQIRPQILYINQETLLFNRSILENITYTTCDMGDAYAIRNAPNTYKRCNSALLKRALDLSLCTQFIGRLPKGLATNAHLLSMGQKHRVIIARAIYNKTPWIILDEPAVYLDPPLEKKLIRNLMQCFNGLIVITHNVRIINLMDRIIILENGKITGDIKNIPTNTGMDTGINTIISNNKYLQSMYV